MNSMCCMKCGREIALGQAFCKECLDIGARICITGILFQ